jgi:hypothetical protein
MTSESKFKTFLFFYGLGLLLILSKFLENLVVKIKALEIGLFSSRYVLLKQNRTKKLIMKINNSLFLFSIVALVSSQSQITTNQKTSIQQGTIQRFQCSDTVKKTKVVVLSK